MSVLYHFYIILYIKTTVTIYYDEYYELISEQCVEFDSYTDHHNQGDMTLANDTLSLKITSSKLQIKRNEMDFTEQLWLILKGTSIYLILL